MKCEEHGCECVWIEGTVNGDPWVCAKCSYRTSLSLSREVDTLQESVKQLEALLSVVSRHGSALMAVLTPEQIRQALAASRESEPSAPPGGDA